MGSPVSDPWENMHKNWGFCAICKKEPVDSEIGTKNCVKKYDGSQNQYGGCHKVFEYFLGASGARSME